MDKFITKGQQLVKDHSASACSDKINEFTVVADIHTELGAPFAKKLKKQNTSCMSRYLFYVFAHFADLRLLSQIYWQWLEQLVVFET
jgi:hypothetical protein